METAERRALSLHQEVMNHHNLVLEVQKTSQAKQQSLNKLTLQSTLLKKQQESALRRMEGDLENVRCQLQEALREGCTNRADALFAKLAFSTPQHQSQQQQQEGQTGGDSREAALDEENGELRALLASIYDRLCELNPHQEYQIEEFERTFELPLSVSLNLIKNDFELALRLPSLNTNQ